MSVNHDHHHHHNYQYMYIIIHKGEATVTRIPQLRFFQESIDEEHDGINTLMICVTVINVAVTYSLICNYSMMMMMMMMIVI